MCCNIFHVACNVTSGVALQRYVTSGVACGVTSRDGRSSLIECGALTALARAEPAVDAVGAVGELVHAVIERDEDGGARAVERNHRGLLVAAGRAQNARLWGAGADASFARGDCMAAALKSWGSDG